MGDDLTPKQRAFIREYLIDLNAAAAARRAGYSPKSARYTGHELLGKPKVRKEIDRLKHERALHAEVTADRVVDELARVAFSNVLDYYRILDDGEPAIDLSDLTREETAAIAELQVDDYVEGRGDNARDVRRVRLKIYEKLRALELLGKHLGMFTDRHEVTLAKSPGDMTDEELQAAIDALDTG